MNNSSSSSNKSAIKISRIFFFFSLLIVLSASCDISAQTEKKLSVPGLSESVTVRRDSRSIPYIEAKNDADLYFAQGYVTASDRLWQMDLLRRLARGETAEIFGKVSLEEDKRWRKYGFAKIAEDSLQYLNADLKSALENYARGVNAYIATLNKDDLPPEFKILQYQPHEWKATDTIVIGKILSDGLSTTWYQDLIRASISNLSKEKQANLINQITPYDVVLYGKDTNQVQNNKSENRSLKIENRNDSEKMTATLAVVEKEAQIRKSSLERAGFYAEDLAASNDWVISGKKTADGKPILANDPHLQPTAPGIWYLTHLSAPNMRVSGVTFPGVPGVVLGHNADIAWGATNVGPDVQDLYLETFDASGKYKTPNGFEAPFIRKEEIKVRPNPLNPQTETINYEVTETRNGVIYTEDGGKKYALKWTARDPKNNEIEAFFMMNRAKNWDDFQSALKTYGGAAQNFVYADEKGNIGWYAAGRIPLRKTGDGSIPYDGATNDGEWTGYIPFGELPHLYNPPEGLIVTANQRTVGTNYKYFSIFARDAAMPWRARRIYDSFKDKTKITMDDVRDVQYDVQNITVSNLAKEIVKQNAASPETLEVLKNWDGRMNADSKGAILTNEIRNCLAGKVTEDNQNVPVAAVRERLLWWIVQEKSAGWLPKQFADYPSFLKTCDTEARAGLTKKLGADANLWTWGKVFQSHLLHQLAGVPFIGAQFTTPVVPLDGSGQTPDVGSNVSMRLIASPGNWDATRHVIPLGESGNPQSPFYKDQFEMWRTGTPAIFPFTKSAVESAAKDVTVMTPANK